MSLRTRLAPTPSGFLHIGNALSFVLTWALARAQQGWILLRIDDLDAARRRPEYLEDIFRTIAWLGIDFDEGPQGPEEFLRSYSQQFRLPLYREALQQLRESGHLYACTCSRKDIRMRSEDGTYPGTCSDLKKDFEAPKTAWRVQVAKEEEIRFQEWNKGNEQFALGANMGDFVVRRKNQVPAYQVASLVDDQHWAINFLVRGADLRSSTAAQLYLARLLSYSDFETATFWHHELVTGSDGRKLSKSLGADAIKNWRAAGKSPVFIFKIAAGWLGLPEEQITSIHELVNALKQQLGS